MESLTKGGGQAHGAVDQNGEVNNFNLLKKNIKLKKI